MNQLSEAAQLIAFGMADLHWTQTVAAKKFNCQQSLISQVLTGMKAPSAELCRNAAAAFEAAGLPMPRLVIAPRGKTLQFYTPSATTTAQRLLARDILTAEMTDWQIERIRALLRSPNQI